MGREDVNRPEVDSLTSNVAPVAGQAAGLRSRDSQAHDRRSASVVAFDFRCAERLGPELVHGLESLHERAACDFAVALSALARSPIAAHVTGVTQSTYAEFVRGLKSPTCLAVIEAEPLAPKLALDISPTVIYPIIDRLLGAIHGTAPPPGRPLTEIERRLAGRIVTHVLGALTRAWQDVLVVPFQLTRVETDPALAAVAVPSELVAVLKFEVSIGDLRGPVTFCLPRAAIDGVAMQLATMGRMNAGPALARRIDPADTVRSPGSVELVAELATVRISAHELGDLRVGDIITTETNVDTPLIVSVEGAPAFYGRPGGYKGRKAILIDRRIEAPSSAS